MRNPGTNLFDAFGGARAMAIDLNEPPTTVQSWKDAGQIPAKRQPKVYRRALERGLPVTAEDIIFPLGVPDDLRQQVAA
jgi:hypothetical protein